MASDPGHLGAVAVLCRELVEYDLGEALRALDLFADGVVTTSFMVVRDGGTPSSVASRSTKSGSDAFSDAANSDSRV